MKQKINNQEWKDFELKGGLTQRIFINPKQEMIALSNGKKISVNNNFFKFSKDQQISAIYHERGHLKKWNKIINNVSNIFYLILGLSLALLIIRFCFSPLITTLNFLNIQISPNFPMNYKQIIYFFIIGIVGAIPSKWLVEIYCDFNAVKNTDKEIYISALRKVHTLNKIKRNIFRRSIYYIPNKLDEIILHPPLKLRIKLLEELD